MKKTIFITLIIGLILLSGYNSIHKNSSDVVVQNILSRANEEEGLKLDISSDLLSTDREFKPSDKETQIDLEVEEISLKIEERIDRADQEQPLIKRIRIHTVNTGENLWNIARRYNIDIDTLIGANEINNMNRIKPGMRLQILPVKGILYKIAPGESLWSISRKFRISMSRIAEANRIFNPDRVRPGDLLILPGAKPEFGYEDRLNRKFIQPVPGRISSPFGTRWGKMHEGVDYPVRTGTSVRAAGDGKVVYSGWARGYGQTIIIEHQKGLRTLYAHNSELLVHSGAWVRRGRIIARSGNTGQTTGPNLHFEVQINGRPVNPLNYLR